MTATKKTTKSNATAGYDGFTAGERAAMKEHALELKTAVRRGAKASAADGEADVLAKIAEMADADRILAQQVHAVVKAAAPQLSPKLWYGMPAYAKDGKIVCFFQSAAKFKARYATLGFNDPANLDDGAMWPTAFALTTLTAADEQRIADLVTRAAN
ncbi:iron chaperone [Streptacidiphilus sp. EB129]|uniref:iron chaperone n=1 Tax=Streptacidiphilus sp. EB129 TaxID=3156262 RepID=UPI0035179AAC